jgi:hypothetical protein
VTVVSADFSRLKIDSCILIHKLSKHGKETRIRALFVNINTQKRGLKKRRRG